MFPLPKVNAATAFFDIKRFYTDLICFDEEEINEYLDSDFNQKKLLELMKRMRQKEFRKRTQGKCLFSLTPNMDLGVKFYTMIKPSRRPNANYTNAADNKQLKSTTRWICNESGAVLYQNQIGTFFPCGGEKVVLKKDDLKKIKFFDNVGMKLLGFKPKSLLKEYHNIRPSSFLYPDEDKVGGTSAVFHALIKKLIEKDKIAICRFIPRETS